MAYNDWAYGAGRTARNIGGFVADLPGEAVRRQRQAFTGAAEAIGGAASSFYRGVSGQQPPTQMRPPSPTPKMAQAPGTAQMKSVTPPTTQVGSGDGIPGAANYNFDPNRVGPLPGDVRQPSPVAQQAPRNVRVPPGTQFSEEGVGRIPTFTMEPTQSRPDYMRESPEQAIRGIRDLQAAQASLRDAQYTDARRRAGDIIRRPGQPRDPLPIYEFQRADDIMRGAGPAVPGNLASFSRLRNAREAAESLRDQGRERLGYQAGMDETVFREGENMRRTMETGRQQMDRDFMSAQRAALENRRGEAADVGLERLRQQGRIGELETRQRLGRETAMQEQANELDRIRAETAARQRQYDLAQPGERGRMISDLYTTALESVPLTSQNPQMDAMRIAARNAVLRAPDDATREQVLMDLVRGFGVDRAQLEEMLRFEG